jgi:hypothetical protein
MYSTTGDLAKYRQMDMRRSADVARQAAEARTAKRDGGFSRTRRTLGLALSALTWQPRHDRAVQLSITSSASNQAMKVRPTPIA